MCVFHDCTGNAADELAKFVELQGTAIYRGPTAGNFALDGRASGEFTTTAMLEVDFGDGTQTGTVE